MLLSTVAAVLLLCVGLFVRAYRNAGPDTPSASGGNFGVRQEVRPAGSAPPTPAPSRSRAGVDTALASLAPRPKVTLTAAGGPGFTIVPAPRHVLVLSARADVPIGTVGYLVPTSTNHNFGTAKNVGGSWRLRTTVTGKPYYAAIFVQAGASGSPITCTISLDGKVIASRSTTGAYGRQVCVG